MRNFISMSSVDELKLHKLKVITLIKQDWTELTRTEGRVCIK